MNRTPAAFTAFVWVSIGAASPARAQQRSMPARARLLVPSCSSLPFEPARVLSILRVELLGNGVALEPDPQPRPGSESAEAILVLDVPGCTGTRVRLELEHAPSGRRVGRSVDLADTPQAARSRPLALAVAELLRTAWSGLAAEAPAPPKPVAPPPAPPIDPAAIERHAVERALAEWDRRRPPPVLPRPVPAPGLLVDALGDVRLFPAFAGALFGGHVDGSVGLTRSPQLRVGVDLGAHSGSSLDPLGDVQLESAAAGVSVALGSADATMPSAIGARIEMGWAWATGRPFVPSTTAASLSGFTLVASLRGSIRLALGERWWMRFDAEAGYVLAGLDARADDRRATGIGGPLLGLGLGLTVNP